MYGRGPAPIIGNTYPQGQMGNGVMPSHNRYPQQFNSQEPGIGHQPNLMGGIPQPQMQMSRDPRL